MQSTSATGTDRPGRDIWRFVEATELPDEATILARWGGSAEPPVLSIICNAFKHEAFIQDALCGFLLQETDFPFEILIHDDASPDGTQERIDAMVARYPTIIRPLYQAENQFSQGRRPWMFQEPRARGEFIAFCEGDDFWTDPKKLQIQVDFLRAHPDVAMSGHDSVILQSDGSLGAEPRVRGGRADRDCSAEDLKKISFLISTLTTCYRRVVHPEAPEREKVMNGDTFLFSLLGRQGGYHFHHDIGHGVYRAHDGGIWSGRDNHARRVAMRQTLFWLAAFHGRMNDKAVSDHFQRLFLQESWNLGLVGGTYGKLALGLQRTVRGIKRKISRR